MSDEKIESKPEQKTENAQSEPEQKNDENTDPKPEQKNKVANSEIIGKKVFFLNPSANMQSQIMAELSQHEYEVYTVKNTAHLTRVLKKYPDSIVYINLDEAQKSETEKWLDSTISAMPDVLVGIFSSSVDEELKNKYLNKPNVKCGFINIKFDMTKTTQQIIKIFESMAVKGRRKYLRATTENEETSTINMPNESGEYINGTIKDISVVGFSCIFESDPGLKKNNLFKNIQIRLHTMLLKAEAVVFGSRNENDKSVYVFLFTNRIDPEVCVKIRKYIQQNLQRKMEQFYK
jgi:hypothetical protein